MKLGTQVLTTSNGQVDLNLMRSVAQDISAAQQVSKHHFILVSSGAIAAGAECLEIQPSSIPEDQAAAAVGQLLLMQEYATFFKNHGITVAQVLLTRDVFDDPEKSRNTKNTLTELLNRGILPIINENDTVSTDEIKFGDNDQLASLVAVLMKADRLMLLTDLDGVYSADPNVDKKATLLKSIDNIKDRDVDHFATGPMSKKSRGGMRSKLMAAKHAVSHGVSVTIANGRRPQVVQDGLAGKHVGTEVS